MKLLIKLNLAVGVLNFLLIALLLLTNLPIHAMLWVGCLVPLIVAYIGLNLPEED